MAASLPFSERVAEVVQLEYAIMIFLGTLFAWLFYKIALRGVSPSRHESLQSKFKNLLKHLGLLLTFGTPYFFLTSFGLEEYFVSKAVPYLGLIVLFSGSLSVIKLTRIAVLEFLFLGHMKEGVPLLIVNIFTLLMSLCLFGWYLAAIFQIQLMPLLATSAVFSLVLGLALQDTISNLFAGLGVQFDGSYQIGDWIEVFYQNQKWAGQVEEISWRATTLISMTDEIIIIPNRTISQALINNFSDQRRPFIRSHLVKVDYKHSLEEIKLLLSLAIKDIEGVLENPAPLVLLWEMNESYMVYKVVYSINDFGKQFLVADRVLLKITEALQSKKIEVALPKLEIEGKNT